MHVYWQHHEGSTGTMATLWKKYRYTGNTGQEIQVCSNVGKDIQLHGNTGKEIHVRGNTGGKYRYMTTLGKIQVHDKTGGEIQVHGNTGGKYRYMATLGKNTGTWQHGKGSMSTWQHWDKNTGTWQYWEGSTSTVVLYWLHGNIGKEAPVHGSTGYWKKSPKHIQVCD